MKKFNLKNVLISQYQSISVNNQSISGAAVWHITTGLCAGVALEFLPPGTAARLYAKDKYLEPMFGDVGQAGTKARICITSDCYNLKPHLHKTQCACCTTKILT